MRILFHHRIASRDGQSVHIEEMIAALERQGHETRLVGPASWAASGFGSSNKLVDAIKRMIPGALYELLEVAYNLKAYGRLKRAVAEYQPDVIYERFSLFLFAGVWVRKQTGLPLLSEVNAPLFEERAKNDGLKLHALGRWAQGYIWRRADHLLPVTGVLGRTVRDYGVAPEKITIVPNGIDPGRFDAAGTITAEAAKQSLGVPPQRLTIGFTGFIRGWNAVHRLLDFAAKHRETLDLHILVVGDGPARDPLIAYAAEKGIPDRLTITGVVERDEVARHVAAFDIAVIPGVTPYASPLKLFEYLQLGRAIVAPDTENIREILTDDADALLFDVAAEAALEGALLRLCSDETLRRRLGAAARETISAKSLTWDQNAKRVVAIGEALVAPRPQS